VKHCLLPVTEENKQFRASEFAKTCARCIQQLQTGLLKQLKLQAKSLIVIALTMDESNGITDMTIYDTYSLHCQCRLILKSF
jgi:hypothetical protein